MSNILFILLQEEESSLVFKITFIVLAVITVLLIIFVITRGIFNFFEMAHVEYFKKKYISFITITSKNSSWIT